MYAGRGGGSSEDGDDEATSSAAAVMRGGGGEEGYGGMRSLPRIGLRQSVNGIEDEEDDVEDGQEETGGERRRRRRGDGATGGVEAEESLNSSGDSEGGGGTTRTYVEDEVDRIKKSLMLMQEQIEKNSITGAKLSVDMARRMDQESLQRNLMNNDLREFKEQQRTAHVHQENELAEIILRLRNLEEKLHSGVDGVCLPLRRRVWWKRAVAHLCCCFTNRSGGLGINGNDVDDDDDYDGHVGIGGRGNRRSGRRTFFNERYHQLGVMNSNGGGGGHRGSVVHSHSVHGSEIGAPNDLEPNDNGLTVADVDLRTPLSLRRDYDDDYVDMPMRSMSPPVAQFGT